MLDFSPNELHEVVRRIFSVSYLSVHRYGTDCVEIGSPGADIKHDAGVSLGAGTVRKEGPFLLAIGT